MQHHAPPGPMQLLHGPGLGPVQPENPGGFPDHDYSGGPGEGGGRPSPGQQGRGVQEQEKNDHPSRLQQSDRQHNPPTKHHAREHPNKRQLHGLRRADVAEHRADQHRDLPPELQRSQRHQIQLADSDGKRIRDDQQQPRHKWCSARQLLHGRQFQHK